MEALISEEKKENQEELKNDDEIDAVIVEASERNEEGLDKTEPNP